MKDFTEGYRKPSESEKKQMSFYLTNKHQKKMKAFFACGLFSLFIGITLLTEAFFNYPNTPIGFTFLKLGICTGLVCLTVFFQQKGKEVETFLIEINKGHFLVAPCTAYEGKKENNVCFVKINRASQFLDDWYEVDVEDYEAFLKDKHYQFKLLHCSYTYKTVKEFYELF